MTKTWITSFYHEHKKAFRWLLVSLLIARVLEFGLPFLETLDRSFLDLFAQLHATPVPTEIYIVEITDKDYHDLFCSTSPLNANLVAALVNAIQLEQPAVIGVDLDTSGSNWADRVSPAAKPLCQTPANPKLQKDNAQVADLDLTAKYPTLKNAPIIWAGVPKNLDEMDEAGGHFQVYCPLGGEPAKKPEEKVPVTQTGLVIFPEDADGRIRRHRKEFPFATMDCDQDGVSVKLEAFDVAVKNKFASACKSTEDKNLQQECARFTARHFPEQIDEKFRPKMEYVNFWGERYSFRIVQASELIDATGNPIKLASELRDKAEKRSAPTPLPMKGHIVLLGGAYGAARDEYWTPFGRMHGVELLANGIQSAADGYILPEKWPPVYLLSMVVDFLVGALVIWIASLLGRGLIQHWIVIALGIAIPFWLLYKFHNSNIWLGAVPVILGVCLEHIHEWREEGKEWKDKSEEFKKKLAEAQKQNHALEQANQQLLARSNELHFQQREHKLLKYADGTTAEVDSAVNQDSIGPVDVQPPPREDSKKK